MQETEIWANNAQLPLLSRFRRVYLRSAGKTGIGGNANGSTQLLRSAAVAAA
jgi:hypothetical protein